MSAPKKAFDYSQKVDALLDGKLSGVGSFETSDFLVLMMAAADQAGISVRAQKMILLTVEADLESKAGGR